MTDNVEKKDIINKKDTGFMYVAAKSNVQAVASSILKAVDSGSPVIIRAIGAGAVNQAIKALAAASGPLATKGYIALVKPGFAETSINEESRTVITLRLVLQ